MNFFEAIVLGILQGLTEFLPISSTAHLRIIPALAGWEDPGAAFTAIVQIGTLAAVLIYFYRDITSIARAMVQGLLNGQPLGTPEAKMGWMITTGTVPIVVFGLLFKEQIETSFRSLYWISAALIGLALLLTVAEWRVKQRAGKGLGMKQMADISWKEALLIGLAQGIALIPGSSRSGVTITGGLFLNLSREAAARFSFLLSFPSVLAAGLFQLYKNRDVIFSSPDNLMAITMTIIVSGIVGYASIAFLLNYLKNHSTTIFILYRLALGAFILLMLAAGLLEA